MATGHDTEGRSAEPGGNVIRFPKDWFGSVDDLVPFATDPEPQAPAASGERRLRAVDPVIGAPGARHETKPVVAATTVSAEDFWGAHSESLHQPVAPVVKVASGGDEVPCAPPDGADAEEWGTGAVASPRPRRSRQRTHLKHGLDGWRPGVLSRSRSWWRVAASLAALLLVVGAVAGSFASTERVQHRHLAAAHDVSAAAPRVLGVRSEPATLAVPRIPVGRRLPSRRRATATQSSAHGSPARHAARDAGVGAAVPVSEGISDPVSESAGDTPAADPSAVAPTVAVGASNSGTSRVSESTETGSSGSGPNGPSGPGGAVGSDCNPKCS